MSVTSYFRNWTNWAKTQRHGLVLGLDNYNHVTLLSNLHIYYGTAAPDDVPADSDAAWRVELERLIAEFANVFADELEVALFRARTPEIYQAGRWH